MLMGLVVCENLNTRAWSMVSFCLLEAIFVYLCVHLDFLFIERLYGSNSTVMKWTEMSIRFGFRKTVACPSMLVTPSAQSHYLESHV